MNKTNRMIAAAVIAAVDVQMAEKEARTSSDVSQVLIHGVPCITINRRRREIILHGADTMCSKKSSKLINTVLSAFCEAKVKNNNDRWFVKPSATEKTIEFTDLNYIISVPDMKLM